MVTMATVFSKYSQNTHQNIPHKILGKVMKFQPHKTVFELCTKNHLGGTKCPPPPGLDRINTLPGSHFTCFCIVCETTSPLQMNFVELLRHLKPEVWDTELKRSVKVDRLALNKPSQSHAFVCLFFFSA